MTSVGLVRAGLIWIWIAGICAGQDVKIPPGTAVVVKTVDAIDSKTADMGKTYRASLDEALVVNGSTVAEKGAAVELKVVELKTAGKLKGNAEVTVVASAVKVGATMQELQTETVVNEGAGKGKGSAIKTGVGGGLGAIGGGLFGGKKGAVIGGAAGAGAGAAVAMMTSGPRVKIPSESRLSFLTK